jgi:hypothetical protein
MKRVVKCYQYLLEGTNKASIDETVQEEINVLSKYEKIQIEMIEKLEQKNA